jgi:23S rRNA pseudouridine2605 synthase
MEVKTERLQKILAAAGLASRRKAEELIAAGLVSVNGHVITEPGSKADPRLDEIRVDGKLLRGPERHVYLALYKPKGYMTTVSDPEGRPTVMELLKGVDERVFPVGRLDYMSEGLLLLTNDGELMASLTNAGSKVAKTYMVKVSGKPTEEEIDKLRNGIMLPPEPGLTGARGKKQPGVERRSFAVLTQPAVIQLAVDQENPWFEVTLTEGRNRQIRRMFEQIGYHIEKIKRIRYGSLTLDLEPGQFRHLTPKEVAQLRKSPDTPFKPKPIKAKRKDAHDERAPRRPRVDSARFVKGRRGAPAADAPAAATRFAPDGHTERRPPSEFKRRVPQLRDASRQRSGANLGTGTASESGVREGRPSFRPRGPEFARKDFAAREKFGRGREEKVRGFDRREEKPRGSDRRGESAGGFSRRAEGGTRGFTRREEGTRGFKREDERRAPSPRREQENRFGKSSRPAFSKPGKPRGEFERKPFSARESRPSFERPGFEKKRSFESKGFGKEGFEKKGFEKRSGFDKSSGFSRDRKFSRGPGKPQGREQQAGASPRGFGGKPGGKPSGGAKFGGRPSGGSKPGGARFGKPGSVRSNFGGKRRDSPTPRRREE